MYRALSPALPFLVASSFALSGSPLGAQSLRLNGPLAQPATGDVDGFELDPSGQRVVYLANPTGSGVPDLFSAPADGSAPAVQLAGSLPSFSEPRFEIAAGGRVLFLGEEVEGMRELFRVPIDGSASPVAISGPLVEDGDVEDFQLTPDRGHAVFLADKLVNGRRDPFVVPVDGSAEPLRLHELQRDVIAFWITPDGSSVLYSAAAASRQLLYSVPLDASQPPLLLTASGPVSAGSISRFEQLQIDLDGQHAAYETLTFDPGLHYALFAVALDGSAPSVPLNESGSEASEFRTAGDRVLYLANEELHSIAVDGTDGRLLGDDVSVFSVSPDRMRAAFGTSSALYSAPVDGSAPPLVLAEEGRVLALEVSPDSAKVAFRASDATGFRGLWVAPIAGGPVLLVNRPRLTGLRGAWSFSIAPDGQGLLYTEDREQQGVVELYGIDAALVPVKLSGPLGGSSDVQSFQISADGQRVVYRADQTENETFELFGAPSDGSLPAVLCSDPLPSGPVRGDVRSYRAVPGTDVVAYLADEDVDEVVDLYTVRRSAAGESVRITGALTDPGDAVEIHAVSPTDDRIVFEISDGARSHHLYSVPAAGGTPVEIDAVEQHFPGFHAPVLVTPDGSRVVYLKGPDRELFGAPIEGGPVVALVPPGTHSVLDFQLAPAGDDVVYRGYRPNESVFELYRVPVVGGAPPQRLNAPLSGERDVSAFRITPDGTHVVYLADQAVNDLVELWSVSLAGGERPERLNGLLPESGDVSGFRVTDDGRWVVFRADAEVDETFDLFRVRVAGRRPPVVGPQGALKGDLVRLTHLAAGRSVQHDFALGPDELTVFFRADAALDDVVELFRVPLDGGAPPLRVSADLPANGDVSAFAVAPDASRVVYTADARVDEITELFGVPAAGGAAIPYDAQPVADVSTFRIAPDSAHVGWLAGRNGEVDLLLAPLDGRKPARRVNDVLPAFGAVNEDFTLLSRGRALYRADQEETGVVELFFGSFDNHVAPSRGPGHP